MSAKFEFNFSSTDLSKIELQFLKLFLEKKKNQNQMLPQSAWQ